MTQTIARLSNLRNLAALFVAVLPRRQAEIQRFINANGGDPEDLAFDVEWADRNFPASHPRVTRVLGEHRQMFHALRIAAFHRAESSWRNDETILNQEEAIALALGIS
jgi:hypothetical protein